MLRVTPFLTAMLLFTWLFLSPQSIATEVEWSIEAHQPHFADINGDGVQDMLLQANTLAQTSSLVLGEGVAAGVGYTVDNQRPLPAQLSTAVVNTAKLTLADFNGDGLADVLSLTPAKQILTLYFSQPAGFSPGIDYTVAELEWLVDAVNYDLKAGDFNGDGHQDLLAVAAKKHSHYLMHTNAVGQLAVVQRIKKNVKWGKNKAEKLLIADYNGDGRADVFALSKKKHKKHHVIYADGSGLLDTKHAEARDLDDWDADTHSVIVAGTELNLLRLHNATGGVDENDIALAQDACEPNCSHQAYTVKTATTASFTALTSVPSTPTTAPGPIGSSYIAINSSYAIKMPSVQGATIYQLYESAHNSTSLPADSSYQRISYGSSTTIFRSTSSVGYRWFKYQACNAAGCSGFSPLRRIYLYGIPGIPNNLSISATSVNVGTPFSVSWTPASGSVDGTVYSVYQAYNGNESAVYSVTRNHWGESSYSYSTAQYVGGSFRYRVQACSPSVGCGSSVVANQTVIAPNTAPVANTDYAVINEDTPTYINVLGNDTDIDGDALLLNLYGAPRHGTFSNINNQVRYVPFSNFNGDDSFSYRVRDGSTISAPAVVYVTVNAVNDAPTGNVVISGSTSVGQTLTTSHTLADVEGLGGISYQWYRNGAGIAGAIGTSYLLNNNDADSTLTVKVSYRDGGGTMESVTSVATAVIKAAVPGWQQLGPIEVADTAVNEPTLDVVNLLASSVSGSASVVGGQASYHIPIALPPGRNGVQPSVSLGYNSQNGNGIVGMGWSLNAGGAISRCAPTYAQDGFTQSVTFTNKDRYCLNGQRLILVDGVYRTEMDSFVVVTPTDAGFSVARPDGSTALYESADVLGWRLTQESWSGGKNTIDYVYDETDAGEHLLSAIHYTGSDGIQGDRAVQFEYVDRADSRESYIAGHKIVSRKRLSAITTVIGERTISSYKLAYQQSGASQRSLLSSVQRCGATDCTPVSSFDWSDSLNFAAATPLKFGGVEIYQDVKTIEKIMPYGDIDGNGTADFPGYVQTNIAIAAKATGEDRGDSIITLQDINGDGWPDAVVYRHNPSSTAELEIFVHSMDGSAPYTAVGEILHSFDSEVVNTKRVLKENATFAGDFDGNGLADLVITQMNGPLLKAMPMGQPRTIKHNYSTPETLSFVDSPAPASPVYDGNGQFSFFSYFIDINGDGLTDVLGWKDQLLSIRINLGNGNFKDWQDLSDTTLLAKSSVEIDFGGGGDTETVNYPKYFASLQSVDINNDGINELLVPGKRLITACNGTRCGDEIYNRSTSIVDAKKYDDSIYQYDAISFELQADGSYQATKSATNIIAPATELAFIDAFGDGNLDVIFNYGPRTNNSIQSDTILNNHYGAYIVRNYGAGSGATTNDYAAVDYLKSVTDGAGNQARWHYRPLSSGADFYQTDHDYEGGGYLHFTSSMYAVQSFKQSNGIGDLNDTQYTYAGAMYHMQGRGFAGFRTLTEKDVARNIITTSTFEQKFPRVSQLITQTSQIGDITIASLSNTWLDNPEHTIANVHHWYTSQSIQKQFDLAGVALSTQTMDFSNIDSWGNIGKITTTIDTLSTTIKEIDFAPSDLTSQYNSIKTTTGDQWQLLTVDSWDDTHFKPTKTTLTASDSKCTHISESTFNSYGLTSSITETGQNSACENLTARQTLFSYTDDEYLPNKITNAQSHASSFVYDMGFGVITKQTDPNSIVTATLLDEIGRPLSITTTGFSTQYIRYLVAGTNWMTRTTQAGAPTQAVYTDSLGRTVRSAIQGFDGTYEYVDKIYDGLGRLTKESLPYTVTANYTEFGNFDALDRPGWRKLPHGLQSTYSYKGLETEISVGSDSRKMSRTYASLGWLLKTTDAKEGTNTFTYDDAGRPLTIKDANSNTITATYNGFGHKTQVDDPNQGITTFAYNTFGELESQTASGVTQTFTRDGLGRITQKDTATYTWDTLKQGLLSSETDQGITRTYGYNNALQLNQLSVTVDGVTRTIKHQYDSVLGRPKALEYPNGLTLKYSYNAQGYLSKTSNANSNYVYREVTAIDAQGHITGAALANNLMSQSSSFNESSGTMSATSVTKGLTQLHGHTYSEYDEYLNITAEVNNLTGLSKSYSYDMLNRLTTYTASNTSPAFSLSVNYAHDAVGNLLTKSDYSANHSGAYEYGKSANCPAASNAGPNALCRLTKINSTIVQFNYDGRGNLINGDGLVLTYNALNKPLTITGRNATTQFTYGSNDARAKQARTVSGQTSTTYYVDKLFEADNDGSWRAYIDDIAVLSWTPEQKHKLLYTLRDRLGSATTLVNHDGQVTSRRYFDPFGRTSSASGSDHLSSTQFTDLSATNRYRRGFTDHEHLNEQQLIHMNGRIYDYNVGRFMSVDPFIQAPTSTQSINPYSYIMNNPLAGTDPTGYMGKCDQNPTCQMQSFFSSTGSGGSSLIGHLMGRLKTTLSNGHDTKQAKKAQKVNAVAKVKSPAAISFVLDKEVSKNSANNIHLKGCGGRYQCSNAYNEFLGMDPIAKEAANKTLGTIVETVDTVSDVVAPVKGLAKQGVKRIIRKAFAPKNTGPYKEVKGHHVHAKAAFKENLSYDPKNGFSISQSFMKENGLDHAAMTKFQRQAFKELSDSGGANTMSAHTRIAVGALQAGGASRKMARSLTAQSLNALRNSGVRTPSNIPWYK